MGTRESLNDRFTGRGASFSDYDHESSHEIERDIQRTRGAMDQTIDALVARLQPQEIARGVWSYLLSPAYGADGGHSGGLRIGERTSWVGSAIGHGVAHGVRVGSESIAEGIYTGVCRGSSMLVRFARENPIPSTIMGAGVAYYVADRFLMQHDQEEEHEREWQRSGAAVYEADVVRADSGGYAVHTESSIVMPPGSDIESPEYPLEGSDGATSGAGRSAASRLAGTASAGASAASHAAGSATSKVSGAVSSAGHAAADAGRSSWESTSRTAGSVASAARDTASSLGHAAADTGRRSRNAVYGGMHAAEESLSHAASATYRRASTLGDATVHGLRSTGQVISSGASHTRDAARDATEQYPLLVGLGCAAVGLMAGFLLPRTRREDEAMGETAEEVRHRGYEMGREAIERGEEMASATASAAMERVEEEGLTPSQLADRLGNVARKAAESTKEAVREEGLTGEELSREATAVKDEAKETVKHEASK